MKKIYRIGLIIAVLTVGSAASAKSASLSVLWKKVHRFEQSHRPSERAKAARLLIRLHQKSPQSFQGHLAFVRACALKAGLTRSRAKVTLWSKRGLKSAEKMKSRWPRKAEGYFWAAIHAGQYAKSGGVWAAITKGLAKKIERNALQSVRLNRRLYGGGAQRVLGRYYYRLPWPMRRLKKSLRFLREAAKLRPNHPNGMWFLADTLWALGRKSEAKRLYNRCAQVRGKPLRWAKAGKKCYEWLKKNK